MRNRNIWILIALIAMRQPVGGRAMVKPNAPRASPERRTASPTFPRQRRERRTENPIFPGSGRPIALRRKCWRACFPGAPRLDTAKTFRRSTI